MKCARRTGPFALHLEVKPRKANTMLHAKIFDGVHSSTGNFLPEWGLFETDSKADVALRVSRRD